MRCLSTPACFGGDQDYLLGRIVVQCKEVLPTVTEGVAWSVNLSVSLSVTIVSHAKTAIPIEMSFDLWTQVGPRNHVLDWGSY